MTALRSIPIDAIRIERRHRKALGSLNLLKGSIENIGLLHPIVITPDNRLIAGQRRLEACKMLGWTEIPAHVVPLEDIVRGEFAENMLRKAFEIDEEIAILRALRPIEEAAAKERQGERTDKHPGNFPERSGGEVRDKLGAYLGKSGRTITKQETVIDAAEAEPEKYGKLLKDMIRTGRVNGPYKRLVVARKAEEIRKEPPPLPNKGPYRVIVADPPWPYEKRKEDPSHRATQPYPQMSIDQIQALDVASIAHEDCILWLWTTNHHMREAFTVLDAWGFQQKTILTWAKDKMGTGDWLRGQSEHCLMAVRGKPIVELTNQTTVIHGPVRAHSQKPDEFYEFVEGLCPAPRYAELFQRTLRLNWDGHGDEVQNTVGGVAA